MKTFIITTSAKARQYFTDINLSSNFIKTLKNRKPNSYGSSLLGRLLVARLAKIKKEEIECFLSESLHSFNYKSFHWSISHKHEMLAAAIDSEPIGIDIEINEPKNQDLFTLFADNEWDILGKISWENFYLGWTAKEACLKKLSLELNKFPKIKITGRKSPYLFLQYRRKNIRVRTLLNKNIILSVSC